MTDLDQIRAFLDAMRERHQEQIETVQLPDGTTEFVASLVEQGDVDTLVFMLKLGYLMGLQAGFAIAQGDEDEDDDDSLPRVIGPLEA